MPQKGDMSQPTLQPCTWRRNAGLTYQLSSHFRFIPNWTEFVRNFRDLSVLLGSARLCPHSFSPPRLITPLNSRREELAVLTPTRLTTLSLPPLTMATVLVMVLFRADHNQLAILSVSILSGVVPCCDFLQILYMAGLKESSLRTSMRQCQSQGERRDNARNVGYREALHNEGCIGKDCFTARDFTPIHPDIYTY
ncbi:hypothetical protein J6590_060096 [Homalodisca vitripennis]|nr:hypothetical protein J6590_060096 [Homalodisca vitripennis]